MIDESITLDIKEMFEQIVGNYDFDADIQCYIGNYNKEEQQRLYELLERFKLAYTEEGSNE